MSKNEEARYLTKDNFKLRFSDGLGSDPSMLLGYLYAIDTIMPGFKKILETSQNFDELKKEILNFVNQHVELRDDVDETWENDPSKYGLPSRFSGLDL